VHFTETLSEECTSANIDVNAVAPGALNTRLLQQVIEAGPDLVGTGFYERSLKQQNSGGAPLEKGADLLRLPLIRCEQRHNRQAVERDMGSMDGIAQPCQRSEFHRYL
jgi:NAD(P)-dependent dehydrogenase (short-subunit alcohol dehydrogenase family)